MAPSYHYALSDHDHESISYRDIDLASEVLGERSFPETLYYTWTGELPDAGERRVLEAMLNTLMLHGVTPSALVSRLTLVSEPDAVQTAVANAVNGVGSRLIGTMKECAEDLHRISAAEDREAAIDALVTEYAEGDERFPGIGHPHLDPVDPRAERLFEIAEAEGVAGEHVEILDAVRDGFEARIGAELPVNATGAIAALSADMGLPPTAARGIAIVSRATGVVAEVLAEQSTPMATDVWQHVEANAGDTDGT
jgi:citrate synthase